MHVQFDVYFSLASIEHVYILLALTLTLASGFVSLVEILIASNAIQDTGC